MDEKQLRQSLAEVSEILTPVPETKGHNASQGSYASHVPPPASRKVADQFDYIRLQARYMMFDLEATRRENRYLRRMLERRTNLGEDPGHSSG